MENSSQASSFNLLIGNKCPENNNAECSHINKRKMELSLTPGNKKQRPGMLSIADEPSQEAQLLNNSNVSSESLQIRDNAVIRGSILNATLSSQGKNSTMTIKPVSLGAKSLINNPF